MSDDKYAVKICCIGAGYVGGSTMPVIAKHCPDVKVTVVDIDQKKIDAWNTDDIPIHEPGLLEVVKVARGRNLFFSTAVEETIKDCELIFICIPTPTKSFGVGAGLAYNLSVWEMVAVQIGKVATSHKIIVEKSTVPVQTAERLKTLIESVNTDPNATFEVLSNPEFLAEGTAVGDLENPDRVVIGGDETTDIGRKSIQALVDVYARFIDRERIITSNAYSAELTKLASNAFLALRVSSINAIAQICEESGADVGQVSKSVGADSRIGPRFLNASLGWGGSCFKKDVLGLAYLAQSYGLTQVADFWKMTVEMNEHAKQRFCTRILQSMNNSLLRKTVLVMGFAFKADTGDFRESPAIDVVRFLSTERANIRVYDPIVKKEEILELFPNVTCVDSLEEGANGASALIICTEWKEFINADYNALRAEMVTPAFLFDGRRCVDDEKIKDSGFIFNAVGHKIQSFF